MRVTQIAVFEEFNLLLVIADKSLIAYHLDVVCPISGVPSQTSQHDSARRAPQKLSGSREVGFFAVGRMKDRTLVFYKKRDGISSTFKVCLALSIDWMMPMLTERCRSWSRYSKNQQRAGRVSCRCVVAKPSSSVNMTSSIFPQKVTTSTCSTHLSPFRRSVESKF